MIQTLDPIRILTLVYWVISWRYTAMTNRRRRLSNRKTVAEHSYTVFFEPAAEGGYVVTCPALPGLVTEGNTLEEAREMARDAILAYLESLRKDGEPIPADPRMTLEPVKEKIKVAIPA